jgi:hypothetical protein
MRFLVWPHDAASPARLRRAHRHCSFWCRTGSETLLDDSKQFFMRDYPRRERHCFGLQSHALLAPIQPVTMARRSLKSNSKYQRVLALSDRNTTGDEYERY